MRASDNQGAPGDQRTNSDRGNFKPVKPQNTNFEMDKVLPPTQ